MQNSSEHYDRHCRHLLVVQGTWSACALDRHASPWTCSGCRACKVSRDSNDCVADSRSSVCKGSCRCVEQAVDFAYSMRRSEDDRLAVSILYTWVLHEKVSMRFNIQKRCVTARTRRRLVSSCLYKDIQFLTLQISHVQWHGQTLLNSRKQLCLRWRLVQTTGAIETISYRPIALKYEAGPPST